MANTKVTQLPAASSVSVDDLLMVVDDPSGTPISKKATTAQLITAILGNIDADDIDDASTANKFVTVGDLAKLSEMTGIFSSVIADGETVTAGSYDDALVIEAGTNVTLDVDSSGAITINATESGINIENDTVGAGVFREIDSDGIAIFNGIVGGSNITVSGGDGDPITITGAGGGGGTGAVDSVNGIGPDSSGDVTLDADDIDDTATTNKFVTAGEISDIASALQPADIGTTVQGYDADTLKSDTTATLTAGYATTAYSAGTKSSGTFTPSESNGQFQYAVNGGAHTLAPPTNDTVITIQYTNNGSAGAITTSGFTVVTGDALTTVNGDDFLLDIRKINGFSQLNVTALQ